MNVYIITLIILYFVSLILSWVMIRNMVKDIHSHKPDWTDILVVIVPVVNTIVSIVFSVFWITDNHPNWLKNPFSSFSWNKVKTKIIYTFFLLDL